MTEASGVPELLRSALVVTEGLWTAPVAVTYTVAVTMKSVIVKVAVPVVVVEVIVGQEGKVELS